MCPPGCGLCSQVGGSILDICYIYGDTSIYIPRYLWYLCKGTGQCLQQRQGTGPWSGRDVCCIVLSRSIPIFPHFMYFDPTQTTIIADFQNMIGEDTISLPPSLVVCFCLSGFYSGLSEHHMKISRYIQLITSCSQSMFFAARCLTATNIWRDFAIIFADLHKW